MILNTFSKLALVLAIAPACMTTSTILPLSGEPPEVETLLKEQGAAHDMRPGSVRAADRFFEAYASGDGETVWYLMDLRAAAAWQAEQSRRDGADAGPKTIISLLRKRLKSVSKPSQLSRVKLSNDRKAATISVTWGDNTTINVVTAMNEDGWRVLLTPEGAAIPDIAQNPSSSQTSMPVDFEEIHKQETGRKQGGGMGGGMGRF